jgi:hypothetical protein
MHAKARRIIRDHREVARSALDGSIDEAMRRKQGRHYRVRIDGEWAYDEAVVDGSNRAGRTMVDTPRGLG